MQVKDFIFNKFPSIPKYKQLIRWQMFIAEYNFEIETTKGCNNYITDFLSRELMANIKEIKEQISMITDLLTGISGK